MSNALRNAAESTAHVLSDLVGEARDLVGRPPIRARRRNDRRWLIMVIVGVVLTALVIGRRRHRKRPEGSDSGAGARLMEKSLAVS